MGALSALSAAIETLKRNPALWGAAFLVTVVSFGLTFVQEFLPETTAAVVSLPLSAVTLLVSPFFMGGLLSMAYEGLDGVSRIETFVEGGKANYLRLLGAMVLFVVLLFVVVFVSVLAAGVVAVVVAGASVTGGSVMSDPGLGLGIVALFGIVVFLAVLVPVFFLQFYGAAVVVSDLGIVAAFKRSAGLVRRNLVSTLGYTAIAILVGFVSGFAAVVPTLFGNTTGSAAATGVLPEVGTGVLVAAMAVSLVVTTVISAFGATFQIAFYDDRLDTIA